MGDMKIPIVKAVFVTRCYCQRESTVPYPPPPRWYVSMKPNEWFGFSQEHFSSLPVSKVRVFALTNYGHREEKEPGVIHVMYEEMVEQRTNRYTEEDLRWALARLLTCIERRFDPHGALAMEEAADVAREILGEPRPDACLEHLFELWKQGHKADLWSARK